MKPDVKINGVSMNSLGWLRESISFPPVASQTDNVVIPGRNSPIRFSVVNNRINYQPRTFKIVLVMLGNRTKFMEMESAILQQFLGQLCKVTISEKPDLYVQGTLQLESDYDVDTHKGSLTINCSDADAYFYHIDKTSKTFSGDQQAVLSCDFMSTVPQITVTEQTKLEWFIDQESFSKTLNKGTWTIPELELHQGENTISITTSGQVTFEYQEGCL